MNTDDSQNNAEDSATTPPSSFDIRSDEPTLPSQLPIPNSGPDFEANLWNPLWAYDLFPTSASGWNRMPIVGADFETESTTSNDGIPEPESSDPPPTNGNSEPNQDSEQRPSGNSDQDNDEDSDDEPSNSMDDDSNNNGTESLNDGPDSDNDLDSDNSDSDSKEHDLSENSNEDGEAPNPEADLDEHESPDSGSDSNENDDSETENSELNNDLDDPDDLNDSNPNSHNEYSLEKPKNPEPPTIPGLTILKTPTGTEYIREFSSWEDFVECAADERLYAWKKICESHNPDQATAGASASFSEAVEMARFRGWPEGRNLLSDLIANITTKSENFEIWAFDVAGMFPIVPAYLSGDPACMIVDPGTDLRTQYPIIRIDYNHGCSWHVTPKDMMTRGAAVLSLANNLEAHGFQTELRIIENSKGESYGREKIIFRYSIVYKKPGQFLDIDRAAFALAHPACLRRLGFALYEQHPELEIPFTHYGTPLFEPNDPESGSFGTIFIPGSKGGETEETSRKVVLKAAEATTTLLETAEAN